MLTFWVADFFFLSQLNITLKLLCFPSGMPAMLCARLSWWWGQVVLSCHQTYWWFSVLTGKSHLTPHSSFKLLILKGTSVSVTHWPPWILSAKRREQGYYHPCPYYHAEHYNAHFPPLRYMVLAAWLATLISVTPQAVIFRVLKHPESDFYQCTTEDFFESLSTEKVLVNNVTSYYLPGGLTPKQAGDLYHTIFNCQVLTYTIQGPSSFPFYRFFCFH